MKKHFIAGTLTLGLLGGLLSASPAIANEATPDPVVEIFSSADATPESSISKQLNSPLVEKGEAPSESPTSKPLEAPADEVVEEIVTDPQTEKPTESPTPEPSEIPSTSTPVPQVPDKQPTKAPTEDPTKTPETEKPAVTPEVPKAPAAPVAPETPEKPVQQPAKTPVAPQIAPAPAEKKVTPAPVKTTPPAPKPAPEKKVAPKPAPAKAAPVYTVTGAIKTKWNSLKGASGTLGAPIMNQKTTSGYTYQEFKNGFIFSSSKYGTRYVAKSTKIGDTWYKGGKTSAKGFGIPTTDPINSGDGTYQKFVSNKWIYSNGLVIDMNGSIGRTWSASGGVSKIGIPTSNEVRKNGGASQSFKKAELYWSSPTGTKIVTGGILSSYKSLKTSAGVLGFPKSNESCGLAGRGCSQQFQKGTIYWSPSTGAQGVAGGINTHHNSVGNVRSFLGYPTGKEQCYSHGCFQYFQGGTVFWSNRTGSVSVQKGAIFEGLIRRGSVSGKLGYPKAQRACGYPNGGCYQDFERGRLWSSNGHGRAYMTTGGMNTNYNNAGGPNSYLGYPISDENCSGGQCVQTFSGGHIGWGPNATGLYRMSECQNLNNGRSKMATGGANRVLLTFTETYRQSYATNAYCKKVAGIYVTDWVTDGYVGENGFKGPWEASGPTRNLYSPSGSFTISEAFGLWNPGTKLPYRHLNPNSRWGGNPWTGTYNKYHESSAWTGYDENMWYFATRGSKDYEQGVVIDYNRPNIVQDAGFAIFLHQNKVPTAGCISLDNWAVVDYIKKSQPGDRVIMGVRSAIFS